MASREILKSEALANLRSSPLVSLSTIIVSCLIGFIAAQLSFNEVNGIMQSWKKRIDAGQTVLTVTTPSTAGLPGDRCEQLNSLNSVVAAGGRVASKTVKPDILPSKVFQLEEVTPGFSKVIWPGLPPATNTNVVASKDLAASLGLTAETFISTTDSQVPHLVTAVPELPPRIQQFQNSLAITVASASAIEACLVEVEPGALNDMEAVLTGWFATDQPVRVMKLVQPRETDVDPGQELAARISKVIPLGAGGTIAVFAFTMLWSRRIEYANYVLAGATREDVVRMHRAESILLYFVPLSMGIFVFLLANSSYLLGETVVLMALLIDCSAMLVTASLVIPVAKSYLSRIDAIKALKGA